MILKNREIKDKEEIEAIIQKCRVCHIGMVDNDKPYVLPFNFVYAEDAIYLHSAPVGKKNEILKANNNICLNFDTDYEVFHRHENVACSWGMKFRSVVINGTVSFIEDYDEKIRILNIVMKKYAGRDDFKYNAPAVKNVCVMKVNIEQMTGKKYGY